MAGYYQKLICAYVDLSQNSLFLAYLVAIQLSFEQSIISILEQPNTKSTVTGWCHDCHHYIFIEIIWSGVCGDKNQQSTIPEINIAPTSRSSEKEKRRLQPPSFVWYGTAYQILLLS